MNTCLTKWLVATFFDVSATNLHVKKGCNVWFNRTNNISKNTIESAFAVCRGGAHDIEAENVIIVAKFTYKIELDIEFNKPSCQRMTGQKKSTR